MEELIQYRIIEQDKFDEGGAIVGSIAMIQIFMDRKWRDKYAFSNMVEAEGFMKLKKLKITKKTEHARIKSFTDKRQKR